MLICTWLDECHHSLASVRNLVQHVSKSTAFVNGDWYSEQTLGDRWARMFFCLRSWLLNWGEGIDTIHIFTLLPCFSLSSQDYVTLNNVTCVDEQNNLDCEYYRHDKHCGQLFVTVWCMIAMPTIGIWSSGVSKTSRITCYANWLVQQGYFYTRKID